MSLDQRDYHYSLALQKLTLMIHRHQQRHHKMPLIRDHMVRHFYIFTTITRNNHVRKFICGWKYFAADANARQLCFRIVRPFHFEKNLVHVSFSHLVRFDVVRFVVLD